MSVLGPRKDFRVSDANGVSQAWLYCLALAEQMSISSG